MGVTLLHFSNSNVLPRNIVGCALSAPDRSSPRGYSRKRLFLSIGSKYSVVHHTSTRDTSTSRYSNFEILQLCDTSTQDTLRTSCHRIRVHHSSKEFHLISLKVAAPEAIIKNPSHIIHSINFTFVGAILFLSYIIFFMTSMNTSLCMSANHFMGSTVIFAIFDR
jgi:hypothetical protein